MENKNKYALGIIAVIALIFGGIYSYTELGWFGGEGAEGGTTGQVLPQNPLIPATPVTVEQPTTTLARVPVEDLRALAKDKYTMAGVTTGTIHFYAPGADVTDPYVRSLDQINLAYGTTPNTSNYVIQTNTNYDVYYNGSSSYYDRKLGYDISYNPETGKGYLLINGASYVPAVALGQFVNFTATATNTSSGPTPFPTGTSLPEVQSGINITLANCSVGGPNKCLHNNRTVLADWIGYDESALSDSMWFRMDIGNEKANTELQDVVMCFKDTDGDMEGNEITSISASFVSGSGKISIPGSLQTYWEDAMGTGGTSCITIATSLGSSEKARWQFDFAVDESEWANLTTNYALYTDSTAEEFEIVFDDLGDYAKKQYPSRNSKALSKTLNIIAIA